MWSFLWWIWFPSGDMIELEEDLVSRLNQNIDSSVGEHIQSGSAAPRVRQCCTQQIQTAFGCDFSQMKWCFDWICSSHAFPNSKCHH
jgi:hypothetical protein